MHVLGRTTLTVLTLAGLTGCGAPHPAAESVPGVPSPPATEAVPSASSASSAPGTPTPDQTTPVPGQATPVPGQATGDGCGSVGMRAGLYFQSERAGRVNALLVLTNQSKRTCTIQGPAALSALDTRRLPMAVSTVARNAQGNEPLITLRTGFSAYSGVQWTAGARCAPVGAFRLTPPPSEASPNHPMDVSFAGFGDSTAIAARFTICDGQISVSPLQSASDKLVSR